VEAVPIVSAYDLKAEQSASILRGLRDAHGLRARLASQFEDIWDRRVVWAYERRVYTQSRLVLVNYESVRRLLVNAFGPSVPVRLLPYTAESAFVHELLVRGKPCQLPVPDGLAPLGDSEAPLVVAVSRHDPRKGLDLLLEALADIRAQGVGFRACLVGPGRLLEAHRALARRLGLDGATVVIPGQVPDPFPYLQHADVFALPSLGEGGSGSLSLLEALQAGVAVVASACDGVPEDVADGHDALLVKPGDRAGLVTALTRVLTDRALRLGLAARARETFRQRFSADTFVAALRQTYGDLGFAPEATPG
jgi:glycosyltransferase involved in cell wall biosynthesis